MGYNSNLEIHNLRSIKDLKIEGLGQFNLFVGENNCGKSTVLEAMYMACAVPQLPLFAMNSGRGVRTTQNEDFLTLFHNFKIKEPLAVCFSDNNKYRKVSTFAIKTDRMPQVIMNGMPQEISQIRQFDIKVESNVLESSYTIHYDQKNVTPERIILSDEELENLTNDKSVKSVQFITAHWVNYNTVEYVNNLVVNKQKSSLIENLQKIDSSIRDIQIGNNNNIYLDTGLPKLMPIHFAGLGVQKFVCIASIVSSLKDGVLLIDEFENGLHYKTMDVLWNAVVSLCKERNVQLFVTTHSYECIESFITAAPEGVVYRIERKDDSHKAIRYAPDEVSEAIKKRWELR